MTPDPDHRDPEVGGSPRDAADEDGPAQRRASGWQAPAERKPPGGAVTCLIVLLVSMVLGGILIGLVDLLMPQPASQSGVSCGQTLRSRAGATYWTSAAGATLSHVAAGQWLDYIVSDGCRRTFEALEATALAPVVTGLRDIREVGYTDRHTFDAWDDQPAPLVSRL